MPERLPKNSCDTHLHVFGDATTDPVGDINPLYQPLQEEVVLVSETAG